MVTDTRTDFERAARDYTDALSAWESYIGQLRGAQAALRTAESNLDDYEAQLRMDPEIVEGRNSEERAAKLIHAAATDQAYTSRARTVEQHRQVIARLQDEAMASRDNMALAKRRLDYCIAMTRLMATEGGEQHA